MSKFFKSRLTFAQLNMIQLTSRVRSILVGLLLGDAWLQKKLHWNPRIGVKQSIKNFPFIWHLYHELAYLCSGTIMPGFSYLRGKIFYNVTIQTRQLACLMEIFHLFYVFNNGLWLKTIKPELFFYLDYIALAYWIMGDGSVRNKGIILCTDSFTLQEVVLLANILRIKFDINPTLHKEKGNDRIYINETDLLKIRPHILPYMHKHFLYRIHMVHNKQQTLW